MESANLQFLPKYVKSSIPKKVDGYDLMEKLLFQKRSIMKLNWYALFDDELFVEDDALFLIEAYNELSEIGQQDKQSVFLGDGSLQVDVSFNYDNVLMKVVFTPYLDKRLSQQKEVRISKDDYCQAWQFLISQMIELV